jgi:hypothetical protein
VLAFAATGRSPFAANSIPAVALRVISEDPDLAGLPASLRPLVTACLAKDPAARPTVAKVLGRLAGAAHPTGDWLPPPVTAERVFLCHSSGDKPQVRDLYRRLGQDGLQPWLDEEDILPGRDWQIEIRRAIRESRYVLVCLSTSSITKSGFVQKEIKEALDVADEQPEGSIFLIPVRLESCEVPARLGSRMWVDLFAAGGYERLLRSLGRERPPPRANPTPLPYRHRRHRDRR